MSPTGVGSLSSNNWNMTYTLDNSLEIAASHNLFLFNLSRSCALFTSFGISIPNFISYLVNIFVNLLMITLRFLIV